MSCYSASCKGLRDKNEDKHIYIENLLNNNNKINNINYYAVYDGHGGNEISNYLHKYLHQYFYLKNLNNYDTVFFKKYIKNVFNHNQKKLEMTYKNKSFRVGSTALIAIISQDKELNKNLYIINLGDCRAVLCSKNTIAKQLSEDHKPNSEKERKRIENLGGKVTKELGDDWRIKNLSVSRAFGDMDTKPYVSHLPDIYKLKLKSSDKFIVLACDGLWDVMSNQEVVDFILKYKDENKIDIGKELANYAINVKGSNDNVSLIIKFF